MSNRSQQKKTNNPVTGVLKPPTDEELIQEFLKKKLANFPLPNNIFNEVNVYDHYPYDLAERYKPWEANNRWYFFFFSSVLNGSKRTQQFYLGGRRNEWFMEDYSLPETVDVSIKPEDDMKLVDCLMCVIRMKSEPRRRYKQPDQ
ncbi:putative transcription factor NAM family [Dioscorea sansibarensis]